MTDFGWIEMNLISFHNINLVEMRKRTPKIAPFVVLIVLLTIPLYYPSIIDSSKKLSYPNTTFPSSIDSLKDTNNPCSSLEGGTDTLRCKENEPDAAGENPGKEIKEEAQPAETESAIVPEGSESSDAKCDLFSGEWVPNPEGPYYTNATCYAIQEHQNCMRSGRPDVGYLKWRWKPDDCELPIFDPLPFLELVRGKSLAFVGDSVARNHMQSLICLLASKVSISLISFNYS